MAFFKYLGEQPRPGLVVSYGPTEALVVPKTDGSKIRVDAPPGGFVIGAVVNYDFLDPFSLLSMRADPRFKETT